VTSEVVARTPWIHHQRRPEDRRAVGGSLRDVQLLAGHSSLSTTQRYIEAHADAQRRIVELV
jgi:hypothetical protein